MGEKKTIIYVNQIIDGFGAVIKDGALLIERNKIKKVGNSEDIQATDSSIRVIDARDYTLLPGLWDAHGHLTGERSVHLGQWLFGSPALKALRAYADAQKLLNIGITSVRDVGSAVALYLKEVINSGELRGPRIFAAGKILSQTAGHLDVHSAPLEFVHHNPSWMGELCDGVSECRKAVRKQLREGADLIKLCTTGGILSERDRPDLSQFSLEELMAIVEEAHRFDRRVAAHAQGTEGVKAAIEAGVNTIEHGIYLTEELCEMMVEKDIILVPTAAVIKQIVDVGEKFGLPEVSLAKARESFEAHLNSIKMAYKHGVKIAAGSDFLGPAMLPHGKNTMEIAILSDVAKMDPMDAIKSATIVAAETINKHHSIGGIKENYLADIILVDGNPLDDINILTDPDKIPLVMKDGKIEKNQLKVK